MSIIDELLLRPVPDVKNFIKIVMQKRNLKKYQKFYHYYDIIAEIYGQAYNSGYNAHNIFYSRCHLISSTGITPDDFGNTNISTTMLKAAESEIKELHIQKLTTQVFGFLS